MNSIARDLGRSPAGVFKILKQESVPIASNKKVGHQQKLAILRLYYERCLSSSEIAKRLHIAKQMVLYWIDKLPSPILDPLRDLAGRGNVIIASGTVDLLPFVEPKHLRWADDQKILLRKANSNTEAISRRVDSRDFFRMMGFYLAEGSKRSGPASLQNTNLALVVKYHALAKAFIANLRPFKRVEVKGNRSDKWLMSFGGRCLRVLFVNAIDGIFSFLHESRDSSETLQLGLSFINGSADGDGSVPKSRQKRTVKLRVQLRITEAKESYALRLKEVLTRLFGVGWIYKPRTRNYYEVNVGLTPQRAAFLLTSGFFSEHEENRKRLALKALDSAYTRRYARLYSLYGGNSFSTSDLLGSGHRVHPDFIGRSVCKGWLIPVGIVKTLKNEPAHWYRSYRLSNEVQILARRILENVGRFDT